MKHTHIRVWFPMKYMYNLVIFLEWHIVHFTVSHHWWMWAAVLPLLLLPQDWPPANPQTAQWCYITDSCHHKTFSCLNCREHCMYLYWCICRKAAACAKSLQAVGEPPLKFRGTKDSICNTFSLKCTWTVLPADNVVYSFKMKFRSNSRWFE